MTFASDKHALSRSRRLLVVAIFLFTLFCLLIIRFSHLQIFEYHKWKKIAKNQHQIEVEEPFKRGIFYLNNSLKYGHPETAQSLVIDVPKFHLFIDPMIIPENHRECMCCVICDLLHLERKTKQKIRPNFYKKARSRRIVKWLSREEKLRVEKWWNSYRIKYKLPKNAIYFLQEYKRSYPYGKLLGQVLHTVREDKDTITKQYVPTGGLEMHFDDVLKGRSGRRIIERSPRNALETDKILSYPIHGADIYLTINHYLQAIAEEEIEKGVKFVKAKGGWAAIMDPHSGEIYAMAQYPFFEPSHYRRYYNDEKLIDHTRIKLISECFEPGSTFKPITIALALLANEELTAQNKKAIFSPEEKIKSDDGTLPGRKPMRDVRVHHYLNMNMAIQKSSNIYMAKLVDKFVQALGNEWYRRQLQEVFGIGEKTNIQLPYENPGLLPTPGKVYRSGDPEWSGPTPYSLAIGYNVLTNSMQMLRAMAVIANGGYLLQPTLVKRIEKKTFDGKTLISFQHKVKKTKVLSDKITKRVVEAMKYVTKPGGAAHLADVYGYTEAGKTSTSEKIINGAYSKKMHFCTFVGFVPADKPKLIIIACIDEPAVEYRPGYGATHYGGKSAAPVFRQIAQRSLDYLGVPQDDPYGFSKRDPRYNFEKADWMIQSENMAKLYKRWNE